MLIHCTMEELIAIRNGEGSQGALVHLDDCEDCRDELDRLHQRVAALKALPQMRAPRDRWGAVKEQLLAERSRQRRRLWGFTSLAAAASMALGLGLMELVPRLNGDAEERAHYVQLIEQAETLQDVLLRMRPESRVLNGRAATAVGAVEDRLMLVDAQLNDARRAQRSTYDMIQLMEQRIRLMDELLRIHATKSTLVGF